ncbi:MAG: hypothetical protein WBP27_07340 [Gemmiger qucibialis]
MYLIKSKGNTAQFPPRGLSTAPAAAAPRSPYRHLELCGIALIIKCSVGNGLDRSETLRWMV